MKTQKSFRKKALISSVAMLLVALVALGSATFAWFSTNTTSTASGINVTTAKQSNLLIAKNGGSYSTLVDYQTSNKILLPASTANCSSWFKGEAEVYDNPAADASTVSAISTSDADKYYFSNGLHIKNDGSTACNDVTVTIEYGDGTVADYVRVALVESSATTVASSPVKSGATPKFYNNSGTVVSYNAVTSAYDSTTKTFGVDSISTEGSLVFSVGNMAAGAEKHYALFVWFEGQDENCKDSTAGQGVPDVTLTVTGTPVEATTVAA